MAKYQQISANGELVLASEPSGPSTDRIQELIFTSLNLEEYSFRWTKSPKRQPYIGKLVKEDLTIDLYIYAWRISNGGREKASEKRIQINQQVNPVGFEREQTEDKKSLLLGVYENIFDCPVFASWSISRNREHGSSKSCFIPASILAQAFKEGFVHGFDNSGNPYSAFTKQYFAKYVELMKDDSLAIFPSAVDSLRTSSVNKLDISTTGKSLIDDIESLLSRASRIEETEKQAIVKQRVGQGLFKNILLSKFEGRCCLCGLAVKPILVGSHIKRWSVSSREEKLDPDNGLLLCALHDALFDAFLISFSSNGELIVSPSITKEDKVILKLHEIPLLKITGNMENYLKWHRENLKS